MESLEEQGSRGRGPRLYHKKSKTGCLRCKQRRVKCDELRPSCRSCSRHLVECVYQTRPTTVISANTTSAPGADGRPLACSAPLATSTGSTPETATHQSKDTPSSTHTTNSDLPRSPPTDSLCLSLTSSRATHHVDDVDSDLDLPEGSWRRLWELRLLHNRLSRMRQAARAENPELQQLWSEDVPNLAISFAQNQGRRGLLYIELAHSALHMWTTSTDEQERGDLIRLQQTYQLMCSKEQRRDIDAIRQASPKLLDYICLTSLRILAHSLALVQTLSLEPWEPPLQWLYMGHGAGVVFRKAVNELQCEYNSLMGRFVNSPPILSSAEETVFCDHSSLDWLLDHPFPPNSVEAQADQELNDDGVRSIYEQALSYICSVMKAIDRKESRVFIARRLGGFAVWVPIEFSKFIEQRRPRALVILAYFMSLWLDFEDMWLIGRAGEWQVRCIHKNLPIEWSCKLDSLFAKFKPT